MEEDLNQQVVGGVQRLLEQALEAERTTRLAVGRYARDPQERKDYRNGYYRRDLGTRLGLLRQLRIRRTSRGYRSDLLPRYQRRQEAVQELVRAACLRGTATRPVGSALEPVLGEADSAQRISRIARGLDAAVERFHRRALRNEYRDLFLKGVVLKLRDGRGKVRRRVVLVAYGITAAGRRELVAYRLAQRESEAAWTAFSQDLYLRGLEGKPLRLVVSDGSTGLQAAVGLVYPQARVQCCWAHKLRDIADKVLKKEGSCVAQAAIYRAKNRRQAERAFRRWAGRWRKRRPRAVACVAGDLDELLRFFSVPEAHRRTVRTTNVIERAFREVRRRTRPMSSFTNPDSCDRIVFGVVSHLNRSWEQEPLEQFTQDS